MPAKKTEDLLAIRDSCTRFFFGNGPRRPADLLAEIPIDTVPDVYGDGGVVAELESEVATLLGKPSAIFVPSGTMAQQITLRVHADRRASRTIVFHPYCHLDRWEGRAYERLHGLRGRTAGDQNQIISLDDLNAIAEPIAALLLELPQRDLGGQLPEWDDLVAQTEWARNRDAALHLDGARLWECGPFYERTYAEICGLFDTVYVSFYKGLGGLTGSCLAGPTDVVDEVREWRKRHGGTLMAMWPYAASDLVALRTRLPKMKDYYVHARALAKALQGIDGVEVVPNPPQTNMMHLILETTPAALRTAAIAIAKEEKVWTFAGAMPTGSARSIRVELPVGDATLKFKPKEFAEIVRRLLTSRAATRAGTRRATQPRSSRAKPRRASGGKTPKTSRSSNRSRGRR